MASSSMCGPSNPLQQLKNHTSFDRSIQQDRFRPSTGSQSSSQFRHQPLQSHPLDHEFEQFLGTPPGPSQQQAVPQQPIQYFAPTPSPPLQQASWATDFQRLQINTPPPAQLQHTPNVGFTGWGTEFLQQLKAPSAAPVVASGSSIQQNGVLGNSGYMGIGMSSYSPGIQPMSSMQEQSLNAKVDYTDAEFDQMFEEAAAQQFGQAEQMDFPQREAPKPQLLTPATTPLSQVEELRPEETQKEAEQEKEREKDDADELAKTAGQLLDSLSQDTSQKFQESQFLALMKKLRDKTVKVEDGKMVEV
ncbi:hypothetical protein ABW19_dt0203231 [Dactylella cylindrospora]|nr:hypothetical protein ABW19_dt0203231 [Dactylella cylindrospora]